MHTRERFTDTVRVLTLLHNAKVLPGLASAVIFTRRRDFIEDARKIAKTHPVEISGIEHIPDKGGCLIIFNHPLVSTLMPALMHLVIGISEQTRRSDCHIVMGHIKPLSLPFTDNLKPLGQWLVDQVNNTYPDTFLIVTERTNETDKRRTLVKAQIQDYLSRGHIVFLSPEGKTVSTGVLSSPDLFRNGSADIAYQASQMNIPLIALGIWRGPTKAHASHIKIGEPFAVTAENVNTAKTVLHDQIASLLPSSLI